MLRLAAGAQDEMTLRYSTSLSPDVNSQKRCNRRFRSCLYLPAFQKSKRRSFRCFCDDSANAPEASAASNIGEWCCSMNTAKRSKLRAEQDELDEKWYLEVPLAARVQGYGVVAAS